MRQNLEPPQQISPKSKLHHKSVQIIIYCSPNNQSTYHCVKRKKEKRKKGTTRVEDNKQTFILKSNLSLTRAMHGIVKQNLYTFTFIGTII